MNLDATRSQLTANHMKQKLSRQEHVFGVWISAMRAPGFVRLAAAAGCDFVFIDMEHSSLSHETVGDMCEMARACGITPVVRPHITDAGTVGRILDMGAMGIMFPNVTSGREVLAMRDGTMYPPLGSRGSTSRSAAQDYREGSGTELRRAINDATLLVAQIESRQGVENLEKLLAEQVIGFIEIGRGDLSTDLGVPLEVRHPRVLEAVDTVIAACNRYGVPCGTLCSSLDDAADMLARGMRSIVYPNEQKILLGVYRETARALREMVRPS